MRRKSFGYIYRYDKDNHPELLVLSFKNIEYEFYRLPGGGVEENESYFDGCIREIFEESGLKNLTFVRTLAKVKYYKEYIKSDVERIDYLFYIEQDTFNEWEHSVVSNDKDNGEVFCFSWIKKDQFHLVSPEFKDRLTTDEIPEIFGRN